MTPDYDIGHMSEIQRHWENQTPVNDKLKKIVESLTYHFVEGIQNQLEHGSFQDRNEMIEQAGNVYELPYGRIGMLPPAVFGDIDKESVELKTDLVVPESDEEIAALTDRYMDWVEQVMNSGEYGRYGYSIRESLIKAMTTLKGEEYPYKDWLASAKAMQQALKDEPHFLMELHRNHRMTNNTVLSYEQLNPATAEVYGGYDSYVLVMSGKFNGEPGDYGYNGFRDFVQLPVTEYGVEAAGKLARITVALNDFVKTSPIIDDGVRRHLSLNSEDESLLVRHTARSRSRHEDSVEDAVVHGIKSTLAEGILTMTQVISFLTAEKVDGYDDHDKLVAAILDSNVIEQLTRIVRPGFIGPATLSGLYIQSALVKKNDRLTLSKEAVRILNAERKEYITDMITKWALYESGKGEMPQVLGIMCPAAAPKGAITELKGVLNAFYKRSPEDNSSDSETKNEASSAAE